MRPPSTGLDHGRQSGARSNGPKYGHQTREQPGAYAQDPYLDAQQATDTLRTGAHIFKGRPVNLAP